MNSINVFKFFIKETDPKIWFKVLVNFIFQFSIVISEILFLSTFFLILNKKTVSGHLDLFYQNLKEFIFPFFSNSSATEIYIVILIIFLVLKNLLLIVHNIYYANFIFKLSVNKSAEVLKSYMNKSYELFSKKEISIYIKEIVKDVDNVFVGIFGLVITIIGEILYIVILLFFLSNLIDFNLTIEILFQFLSLATILFFLFYISKKVGETRAENEIQVFKVLSDTLNVFKEIKLLENSKEFILRFKEYSNKFYGTRVVSGGINIAPKFILEFFLLIFFFIIYKNEAAELNIDEFVLKYSVVVFALLRLIPSFSKIASSFSIILYNLDSIKFISPGLKNKTLSDKKKILSKNIIKKIELKNINLNYTRNNKSALSKKFDNLNLNFKKNNIYGIYGESGSGKTSLLNLLSGFIKPNEGKILINNKSYKFYDLTKKFKIGYAPQIATILDENIELNVTLSHQNKIEDILRLKNYLKQFNLKRFLNKNYFKNNSISSIKNMSGGEKQRIGFIRSIIHEPNLLLLDEPTAFLDKKNEKRIFDFLNIIKQDKIIVVTSHKKEQKKYFDYIINL